MAYTWRKPFRKINLRKQARQLRAAGPVGQAHERATMSDIAVSPADGIVAGNPDSVEAQFNRA
jgi:hypothetical protein